MQGSPGFKQRHDNLDRNIWSIRALCVAIRDVFFGWDSSLNIGFEFSEMVCVFVNNLFRGNQGSKSKNSQNSPAWPVAILCYIILCNGLWGITKIAFLTPFLILDLCLLPPRN